MAVRVYEYVINEDSIASSNIVQGGVQGEHNATKINFIMSDSLVEKLRELEDDKKIFAYHFIGYDGAGGSVDSDPIKFSPLYGMEIPYTVERWQTKFGGTIQVFLVITLTDSDSKTEMELFAYNIKMMLKPLPASKGADYENYEAIATLAIVVKQNTEKAEIAAKKAENACERTEAARIALENGTEWVFDGGNAAGKININFLIDDEMNETSKNPVANNIVKKYIDDSIRSAILAAHPIGSYYWSENPTSPSELFGGKWERIKDRFVLAVGDTFENVNILKGSTTVTLKAQNLPAHYHKIAMNQGEGGRAYRFNYDGYNGVISTGANTSESYDLQGNLTNSAPFDIMPPYITAYCWRRIE